MNHRSMSSFQWTFAVAPSCQRMVKWWLAYCIKELGVLLKCGPMSHVYLSCLKMPNYNFVNGKNQFFLSNDLSRIENGSVIRFMVFSVRWENEDRSGQFKILASIEDASLGPIQLAGSDSIDLKNLWAFMLLMQVPVVTALARSRIMNMSL